MRIVETDNYGGDYPDEKFLGVPWWLSKEECEAICEIINRRENHRYWKVVDNNYELQPGFEP
jgi:hypothetical protein